ncbi:CoA transferase [bacterium]|nr:MAG: CoA transferase [bacterium]
MLSGIKLLCFTQFLLGPAAAQYLGDLGAEVVKVEAPGSGAWERHWSGGNTYPGGVSAFMMLSHRNVRSVTLNLKHPKGRELALRLAQRCDVLVENFRPGVMERFGLAYSDVRAHNPRIIYASASGYGSDSPFRDLPGQDLLIQAISGLAAITGCEGEAPVPAGAAIVDQHAAALLAMGILGALFHRERTGEGQRIEVTMVQAALDLQSEPVVYWLNDGQVELPRERLASAFHEAPYGIYATGDGYLAISITSIATLSKALGDPLELAPYLDRQAAFTYRNEIRQALDPLLRAKTTAEWLDALRAAGVWCAPVNDYEHVFADPVIRHIDPILEFDHPRAGRVKVLKHPVRYESGEPGLERLPPALGQHTDEILKELGLDDREITELHADGVA